MDRFYWDDLYDSWSYARFVGNFENIGEDKKMNKRGSQMSETVTGSVNCGTLSTAGISNAFWGQGIIGETSKFRPIKIDRVANGFIVEICRHKLGCGCQTAWRILERPGCYRKKIREIT
jgi:hypothetical protein